MFEICLFKTNVIIHWRCLIVQVGEVVRAKLDGAWRSGCKVTRIKGKYIYVSIPGVLDDIYGLNLVKEGEKIPLWLKDDDEDDDDEHHSEKNEMKEEGAAAEKKESGKNNDSLVNVDEGAQEEPEAAGIDDDEPFEDYSGEGEDQAWEPPADSNIASDGDEREDEDEQPAAAVVVNADKKKTNKKRKTKASAAADASSPKKMKDDIASEKKGRENEDNDVSNNPKFKKRRTNYKKKTKNKKWYNNFCERVTSEDERTYHFKCGKCSEKLKTTLYFTSSPIIAHLKAKHMITKMNYLEHIDKNEVQAASKAATPKPEVVGKPHASVQQKTTIKRENSKSLKQAPLMGYSYRSGSVTKKGLTRQMVLMCAQDLCPVSIVERKGFKGLMKYLSPRLEVASRTTLRTHILKAAEVAKGIIREEIGKADVACHITTDGWSDKQNRSFCSLTIRYVSNDFRIVEIPGFVRGIKGRHTIPTLSRWLNNTIDQLGITVHSATTDSAANQVGAVKQSISEGKVKVRLPCVAHIINLVINQVLQDKDIDMEARPEAVEKEAAVENEEDLEDCADCYADLVEEDEEDAEEELREEDDSALHLTPISNTIKRIRKLVTLFRKSNVMTELLLKVQLDAREDPLDPWSRPRLLKLLLDCPTRWSSTFFMLKRLNLLRPFVELAKYKSSNLKKKHKALFLSEDEWDLVEELTSVLAPFYAATVTLSGHSYVNMSVALSLWKRIAATLESLKEKNDFVVCDELCDRLVNSMEGYRKKYLQDKHYLISAALDPNSKRLKFIKKEHRRRIWEFVGEECATVFAGDGSHANRAMKQHDNSKGEKCKKGRAKDIAESFMNSGTLAELSESDDSNEHDKSIVSVEAELKSYREFPISKEWDTLAFWRINGHLFPTLSKVAQVHLGLNASSAASERIFSSCGFVTNGRRNQISRGLLCALILLNEFAKRGELWSRLCNEW